ncbi:MAG: molybdopterin-dependent oxidoreductase [Coriobacteriales bacterium]|nr:molybdopterin-dependent oxidoreductase [Coriobacteriales bacterium]
MTHQNGCVKGHSNPLRLYATNRVLYPMRQTGERGSDNWEQVSWDEALSLVAEKFQAAIDEYGPESIGVWIGGGNSGGYITGAGTSATYGANSQPRVLTAGIAQERFVQTVGCTILTMSFDVAQLFFQFSVLQAPFNSIEDFQNSKTILLWGANPTDAQRAHWPFICKAKENGARLITIDPQYTNAAAHSDTWVPIRVGSDAAMALAMCNYIIDNDLVDYDYMRNKSVGPLLIKEDGRYLRLSDLGMDLEEGSAGSDGEPTHLDSIAVYDEKTQTFGSSRTVADPALTGSFDADGTSVRTVYDLVLENLMPFTVEWAAEECGVPAAQIEEIAQVYATNKPALLSNNWGIEHTWNSWRVYLAFPLLASLTGNFGVPGSGYSSGFSSAASKLTKAPITNDWSDRTIADAKTNKVITGEYLYEIMETGTWAGEDFTIRCLYTLASNPLHSSLGATYLREAISKVDFVVVADPFMTDTAKWADLVLPVALSWESEDFIGTYMMQKAVEPAGECQTDFEIFKGIAEHMGYDDLYTKSAEEYLRAILDTPENIEAGVAYDDYKEKGIIFGEFEYAESVLPEFNPTGRTQFYLEEFEPRDDYGQEVRPIDRIPYYEHAYEAYQSNPLRERYPLFGLSYHDNYHAQGMFTHNPLLDEFRGYEGKPYMRIHEDAAAERGIRTGDAVRVFNDHGSCTLTAVVTKGIQAETVLMPHGWQEDEFIEGHPQQLTAMCLDPITSNDNFNDWLCQVEKA